MDRNGEGMWSLKGTRVVSLTTLDDVVGHREGTVVSDHGFRSQPPHPQGGRLGVAHVAMREKAQAHRNLGMRPAIPHMPREPLTPFCL